MPLRSWVGKEPVGVSEAPFEPRNVLQARSYVVGNVLADIIVPASEYWTVTFGQANMTTDATVGTRAYFVEWYVPQFMNLFTIPIAQLAASGGASSYLIPGSDFSQSPIPGYGTIPVPTPWILPPDSSVHVKDLGAVHGAGDTLEFKLEYIRTFIGVS
jgi:hypothetical protein